MHNIDNKVNTALHFPERLLRWRAHKTERIEQGRVEGEGKHDLLYIHVAAA
jgi:hypothetical protein